MELRSVPTAGQFKRKQLRRHNGLTTDEELLGAASEETEDGRRKPYVTYPSTGNLSFIRRQLQRGV